MQYSGDVTLPDGRQFHVVACFTEWEPDTNACDLIGVNIFGADGNELDADAYNEEVDIINPVGYPPGWGSKTYLWELCVELVTNKSPDEPDDDWF
jgi:hypothetical protein